MFGFLVSMQVHSFMLGLHQPHTYTNASRNGNSTEAKLNIKRFFFVLFTCARKRNERSSKLVPTCSENFSLNFVNINPAHGCW